jgi:hypothetical protein
VDVGHPYSPLYLLDISVTDTRVFEDTLDIGLAKAHALIRIPVR